VVAITTFGRASFWVLADGGGTLGVDIFVLGSHHFYAAGAEGTFSLLLSTRLTGRSEYGVQMLA
jgi:hypothetical protein